LIFRRSFKVRASLEAVAAFHLRTASLPAITPPPVEVYLTRAPAVLGDGDEMEFELRLGPISLPWTARIEAVSPRGFVDRQLRGPFAGWTHHHRFVPLAGGGTEVVDHVEAKLRPHPIWGPVGLAMWLSMPFLFGYRSWATRRILSGSGLPGRRPR
jgi:ligand-binding SRPBCC domain-containing protein